MKNGFKFSEIVKLIRKIHSSISNVNIRFHLKIQIPIMHRQFFGITSQNPDYVKKLLQCLKQSFKFLHVLEGLLTNKSKTGCFRKSYH